MTVTHYKSVTLSHDLAVRKIKIYLHVCIRNNRKYCIPNQVKHIYYLSNAYNRSTSILLLYIQNNNFSLRKTIHTFKKKK